MMMNDDHHHGWAIVGCYLALAGLQCNFQRCAYTYQASPLGVDLLLQFVGFGQLFLFALPKN